MRDIFANHWHLLQEDPILNKYIGQHPEVVSRWAMLLRDRLTSSNYTPTSVPQRQQKGIFKRGKCTFCPWVCTGTTFALPNGELSTPYSLQTAALKGLYAMQMWSILRWEDIPETQAEIT